MRLENLQFDYGPWNVYTVSRNVIMGPWNVIIGPWNVNKCLWNVIRGPVM